MSYRKAHPLEERYINPASTYVKVDDIPFRRIGEHAYQNDKSGMIMSSGRAIKFLQVTCCTDSSLDGKIIRMIDFEEYKKLVNEENKT